MTDVLSADDFAALTSVDGRDEGAVAQTPVHHHGRVVQEFWLHDDFLSLVNLNDQIFSASHYAFKTIVGHTTTKTDQ